MKVEVAPAGSLLLKEVYDNLRMETAEGNAIEVCMRDDTFEIRVAPKDSLGGAWWRVNMQEGTLVTASSPPLTPVGELVKLAEALKVMVEEDTHGIWLRRVGSNQWDSWVLQRPFHTPQEALEFLRGYQWRWGMEKPGK